MYQQVRDHGVFTAPQPVTVDSLRLTCTKLEAEKACLDKQLAPLLQKIEAGDASAEELALVPELAEDARVIATRLQRANLELQIAQEIQEKKDAESRRDRFDELVILTRRKRTEFARLYRETCVVLGQLCANVDEATRIANSFAAANVAGMNPVDRNSIAEMTEPPDPLPILLDSGFAATTEFGWNLRLSIIPLQKIRMNANEETRSC
jgi:hypothetical protein